jgi:thiamine biosynthesis lipoprotein
MKKILMTLCLITTLIISQTACTEKTEPVEKTSYYMDTICKITVYDMEEMSEENAAAAIDAAFALCADEEALISATIEGSDVYRINHAEGQPVACDDTTIAIINKALEYGRLSDGKFDITIGKATDLWDFHQENPSVPSAEDVEKAMEGVDYRKVKVEGNTVTLEDTGAEITLGGIGKGCIADLAAEKLQELGVTSAIINFGGNIVAIGDKSGENFNIGVEKPFAEGSEIVGSVSVKDATVVTSGIYERGFEADGKYYHHILDVETGWPAETDVVSVTLVGSLGQSGDCDAMSTICLMLGVEKGVEFIENIDGVEAVFIDADGNLTRTSGMEWNEVQ